MDSLVTAEWLARNLDDPDLVVLDCSAHMVEPDPSAGGMAVASAADEYAAGHIPGAGFADPTTDGLADRASPLLCALPSPERFCAAMGALGVGDGARVVLYDTTFSAWAARLWWLLRWVGVDGAALLDGGLRAWIEAGRPLSTAPAERAPKQLAPRLRPELIADAARVRAALDDPRDTLVDALPAEAYRGEIRLAARAGHIPGAINLPAFDLLDAAGRFKSSDALAALLPDGPPERAVAYCGAGVMAASAAFALHRLGVPDIAVYAASLQDWAADPANPMVCPAATPTATPLD